jgi:capsular exopolysaccharide synthesis family protein
LRKLTDGLRTEYQKAQIEEAVEVGQVDVLDLAPLPRNPVGLAHMTLLVIGLVMGTLAGGGAAVVSDQANTSIRRRDEIRSVLRLPELATIPRTVRRAAPHSWAAGRHLGGNGKSAAAPHAARGASSLAVWNADRRAVEAYRVLRTSLSFSTHLRSVQTLVVTSAAPREGKTTVAVNLAATYAQQGGRVLLVDADVRRPSAHNMLGVPQGPGLAETLAGRCGLEETVRATEVENLFVLPAGGVAGGPTEPLEAIPIFRLLATLATRFDLIVVDSPPVLVAADAAILCAAADAVVFVVRAGQTRRDEARDALRQLAAVGARVVGAALNDPDTKVDDHAPAYAGYNGYSADAYAGQHG